MSSLRSGKENGEESKSGYAAQFKCKACGVSISSKNAVKKHRKTEAHKIKEQELLQMHLEAEELSRRKKQRDTLNLAIYLKPQ